jgi:hypothetical protein
VFRIARKVAAERVLATVDPDAPHSSRTIKRLQQACRCSREPHAAFHTSHLVASAIGGVHERGPHPRATPTRPAATTPYCSRAEALRIGFPWLLAAEPHGAVADLARPADDAVHQYDRADIAAATPGWPACQAAPHLRAG